MFRLKSLKFKAPPFLEAEVARDGPPARRAYINDLQHYLLDPDPDRVRKLAEDIRLAISEGNIGLSIQRLLTLAYEFHPEDRELAVLLAADVRASMTDRDVLRPDAVAYNSERRRQFAEIYALANLYESRVRLIMPSDVDHNGLYRPQGDQRPQYGPPRPDSAVRCLGVGWEIGSRKILEDVSFEVGQGKILAVVGRNGAGKTSLLRLLAQKSRATQGSVSWPLLDASGPGRRDAMDRISVVSQHTSGRSQVVGEAMRQYAALRGIRGRENDLEVEYSLARMGLTQYRDHRWNALSGGFRTRLSLGLAILARPAILVLDEPLGPLDHQARNLYLQLLLDMARSSIPTTVIISSQDILSVERVADLVLVLDEGRIVYFGPPGADSLPPGRRLYELETPANPADVAHALDSLEVVDIDSYPGYLRLQVSEVKGENQVLALLIDGNVPISYFREMSTSAQLLVEQ